MVSSRRASSDSPPPPRRLASSKSASASASASPEPAGASSVPSGPPPPKGIAVIVGWLGAEERHLDKYASWWRSRGWETRLIAFDASTTMSFAAAEKAFDGHLADLAARLAARAAVGASPRLAFHAFSNTGWIMYARFVELLAPLGIRAAGAVIDSAPHTAICTKVWAAGFVSATSPKLPPAAAAKTLRYRAARALFKLVWAGERKARFDALVKAEARVASFPQLYIYSATDHVIPAASVRAVVQARRRAGVVGVHALELADSKHVQHLRSHPREYLAALEAFEEAELLGRGDRYLSSGMLAVAADAAAAVEAAKRAAAAAAAASASAAAAAAASAAAAAAASSAPLPADAANKNTATVTVVRGGSGIGPLEKAGSEKMAGGGADTVARTTSLAAALARVLHRSSSAPKASSLIESITTSAGVWSSPFGAVSANAKLAAAESEEQQGAPSTTAANLALTRSQSLGGLPASALDLNALCLAAGIVFPAEELSAI